MFTQPATLILVALTAAGSAAAHEHTAPHGHQAEAAALTVSNRLIDGAFQDGLQPANFTVSQESLLPAAAIEACRTDSCVRASKQRTVPIYPGIDAEGSAPGLGSLALFGLGLLALGLIRRRQRPRLPG